MALQVWQDQSGNLEPRDITLRSHASHELPHTCAPLSAYMKTGLPARCVDLFMLLVVALTSSFVVRSRLVLVLLEAVNVLPCSSEPLSLSHL